MQTIHTLLITRDEALPQELESAARDLSSGARLVVHAENDVQRGIEYAVDRGSDLVVLALDVDETRRAASDIHAAGSKALVVVAYRPEVLGDDPESGGLLIDLMRSHVRDFLRRPISSSEVEEMLQRHVLRNAPKSSAARGRVLAFVGNKGGVGKSTVSLNVACRLAQRAPERVLLVDASLQHGAMSELLDLTPEATIADAARQIDRLDERLLRMLSVPHESGLRVLAAPPNAVEAATVDERTLARILAVARKTFDHVVVDTFPQIDGVTISVLDVADRVFVILNDFVPAVLGTADLLTVIERLGVAPERVRVVLNHSHTKFRGQLRPEDIADRIQHDIDFDVPFSKQVLSATNSGMPYIFGAPAWRGFGRAIRTIERDILSGVAATDASPRDVIMPQEPPRRHPKPTRESPSQEPAAAIEPGGES